MKNFLLFFLIFSLAACQPTTPKNEKHLRLNIRSDPATLDPRKGCDVISAEMQALFFEGLTRLNPDGTIELAQAKIIEISPDQTVYTFHLRDTYWSNQTPVTAFDFEKAWQRILDPTFPAVNAYLLYPIKHAEAVKKGLHPLSAVGITAPDSKTLVITLEKPTPYFLNLTAFCTFYPVCQDASGQDFNPLISNGPYILSTWKHNNEIIALKNPLYWEKEKVTFDSLHFSMVENEMTALHMFENHELDILGSPLCPLPLDASHALQAQGKLLHKSVAATTIIAFNTQQFPFNHPSIRKALCYAIHRQEIVSHLTQLHGQVALQAIPPTLSHSKSFFQDNAVAEAQQLLELGLKDLGIKREDLPEIIYNYTTADHHHKIAQEIQQQWQKNLGIKVRLVSLENKVLMSKLTKRDYMAAQCSLIAPYFDPMSVLERFKCKDNVKNYAGWENAAYTQLLDQSFYETGDERLLTLEKAEAIFLEEMPFAPIYHWDYAFVVQPHLKNRVISPVSSLYREPLE